jgi:5'-3' exonuclease
MINHVNPDGHHIGGLTGFLKSIGYAIRMADPTKVVIVFDGVGGASARRNLFPDYKANRNANRMTNYSIFTSKEEETESINNQMSRLIQYLKCLPVRIRTGAEGNCCLSRE